MLPAVKKRREKVSELLRRNFSETEIARRLGVSRQTIVRDVKFLKTFTQSFLDDLAKDGFIFEYKMTLEKVKLNGERLEELYENEHDKRLKLDILRDKDRNAKLYIELLGESPTIHAYRKATQLKPIQNVS